MVAQDEYYPESKNSLRCIFNSPGEGNTSYHWDDCRSDTSCGASLTDNFTVWNDAYNLDYLEDNGLVHYNLIVKNVTFSSAGTYQCRLHRNSNYYAEKGRMLIIGEFLFKCYWNIYNIDPGLGPPPFYS